MPSAVLPFPLNPCAAALLLVLAASAVAAQPAVAQAPTAPVSAAAVRDYDLPAGPLSDALPPHCISPARSPCDVQTHLRRVRRGNPEDMRQAGAVTRRSAHLGLYGPGCIIFDSVQVPQVSPPRRLGYRDSRRASERKGGEAHGHGPPINPESSCLGGFAAKRLGDRACSHQPSGILAAIVPLTESSKLQVTNPYGRTKLICEDILRDLQAADPRWHVAILRYFNPVGAHISGTIGEHPNGIPNNLMPFITQVAVGKREFLSIFGNDYPTPDGTGVRDYIHVVDLAQGHLAALRYLQEKQASITVNLGTGRGVSVQDLANTFSRVTGVAIPYQFVVRRPGDVASCFADTQLAETALGWKAQLDVDRMCADAWRWQS
eukprot:gene24924-31319_t